MTAGGRWRKIMVEKPLPGREVGLLLVLVDWDGRKAKVAFTDIAAGPQIATGGVADFAPGCSFHAILASLIDEIDEETRADPRCTFCEAGARLFRRGPSKVRYLAGEFWQFGR